MQPWPCCDPCKVLAKRCCHTAWKFQPSNNLQCMRMLVQTTPACGGLSTEGPCHTQNRDHAAETGVAQMARNPMPHIGQQCCLTNQHRHHIWGYIGAVPLQSRKLAYGALLVDNETRLSRLLLAANITAPHVGAGETLGVGVVELAQVAGVVVAHRGRVSPLVNAPARSASADSSEGR